MFHHQLSHRVPVAIMIVLPASIACASAGANGPGSAPRVSAGDTASMPMSDGRTIESMFAGRFPGVSVTRTDGGGLQIRIRGGAGTFFSGEEPLYVLDETPLPTDSRGVVFLNPYDIQKIEVLKNPADIAIYGLRGANGVIKITTKRPGGP